MEKQIIEKANSIESKILVNHVDSGLPRWLIEAAFVSYLLQAVINWSPLLELTNALRMVATGVPTRQST